MSQRESIIDYIEEGGDTSIQSDQIATKLKGIKKSTEKDFVVVPIRIDQIHFVNAIIKFNSKTDEQEKVYIFDSLGEQSSIKDKRIEQLNLINLQGKTNTCGYWATNFTILVSQCKNFEEIKEKIDDKSLIENLKK